ncbi:hypothetical protein BD769DRAFT_1388829 [Suillus cothurnatus]|nr:hypothetical protein BD769DRAFT_1388829 [Suillus cothurnatus]
MAEIHETGVDINQYENSLDGQVGEVEERAGAEEQGMAEEQSMAEEECAEMFAVTRSTVMLWDYSQEIAQDNTEFAHAHPHAPCPIHPPVQMSRRDKCLLVLMVEDRREAVIQLWEELNEIERLLGLENI